MTKIKRNLFKHVLFRTNLKVTKYKSQYCNHIIIMAHYLITVIDDEHKKRKRKKSTVT